MKKLRNLRMGALQNAGLIGLLEFIENKFKRDILLRYGQCCYNAI